MGKNFKIFNKVINKKSSTLIIAEIGINHLGDKSLCKEMIFEALNSGADCVKLQTVNVEESYLPDTDSYKAFKEKNFTREVLSELCEYAISNGGFLFSTPSDISSLKLLESVNICAYKVSSGLFTNIPLIEQITKKNKPIILSTGMAKDEEIAKIVNFLNLKELKNIALLHCVSLYPADYNTLNLSFINKLSDRYGLVTGYSDHSKGDLACLAAVSMGAKIIEKHFTIDNHLDGGDNSTSMHTNDFKKMCIQIRNIEKMLTHSVQKPHKLELELRDLRYRKICAKRDIKVGEKVSIENVNFMRSAKNNNRSIDAYKWSEVVGKNFIKNVKKHSFITFECLKK